MGFTAPGGKFLFTLLQLFILYNSIKPNKAVQLRWNWVPVSKDESTIDFTQSSIWDKVRIENDLKSNKIKIVQHAPAELDKNCLLLLCNISKEDSNLSFSAAVTKEISGKNYILHWMDEFISESSKDALEDLKHSAELYGESLYAFQHDWQPFEYKNEKSGKLHDLEDCIRDTAALISRKGEDLIPISIWTLVQNTKIVVLYSFSKRPGGAYAIIGINSASGNFEVFTQSLIISRFTNVIAIVWKPCNFVMAFEPGWNGDDSFIKVLLDDIKSGFKANVPWIQNSENLAMLAKNERDGEKNNLISIIFQKLKSFGKNTLFVICNKTESTLIHVSVSGTLDETLSAYHSYMDNKLLQTIKNVDYVGGVSWCKKEENNYFTEPRLEGIKKQIKDSVASSEISPTMSEIKTILDSNKCDLLDYGLLANRSDIDYKSKLNICVIYATEDKQVAVHLEIDNNEKTDTQNMTVKDILMDKSIDKNGYVLGSRIVKNQCLCTLKWIQGCLPGFDLSFSDSPLFKHLSGIPEITHYSQNGTTLLIIMKFITEEKKPAVGFVALKKDRDDRYKVTWLQKQYKFKVEIDSEPHAALELAKTQAEMYHFNSNFPYQENWQASSNTAEERRRHFFEICFWIIPDTDNQINIISELVGKDKRDFHYATSKSDQHVPENYIHTSSIQTTVSDVFSALAQDLGNLTFSKPVNSSTTKNDTTMRESMKKYLNSQQFLLDSVTPPTTTGAEAVFTFKAGNELPALKQASTESAQLSGGEVQIRVPKSRFEQWPTCQPPEVKGDERLSLRIQLLEPFTFTTISTQNNWLRVFSDEEFELILNNASWKATAHLIVIEKERKGDLDTFICSLFPSDPETKFLVIWDSSANELHQKLRYVGSLGEISDVEKEYKRYIACSMKFKETQLMGGIVKYDTLASAEKTLRDGINEYLATKLNGVSGSWDKWQFGQIMVPFTPENRNVFTYCLFGKTNTEKYGPHYNSIIIRVKENIHGIKCISLESFDLPRFSILQPELALLQFAQQYLGRKQIN